MKKITLYTKLHNGIYASQGGGVKTIVSEWNIGPRNLLAAITELNETIQSNIVSYGNIGCGSSWLEIDGEKLNLEEILDDLYLEEFIRMDKNFYRKAFSNTECAKKFLKRISF